MLGLSVNEQSAQQRALAEASGKGLRRCIFLLLTGGASHFETFDPKPNAPLEIRGPFRPISTTTPGVFLSETLPLLARRTDKIAILRSLGHDATPIHETGQQLIQTGRLARGGIAHPSLGSILSRMLGARNNMPPYAVLPRLLGNTGVAMWQGQKAGYLGAEFDPWCISSESASARPPDDPMQSACRIDGETESCRRAYGDSLFGRSCLQARRMVEQGVRFVTVNMFDTLDQRVTWDCHAQDRWSPATLTDYQNTLCPDFDRAFTALLDDLANRGLLEETLVVATGEFGRTPKINAFGGRDHWTHVWSAVVAGGGVQGGRVIGASDPRGSAPADRPIAPADFAATVLHSMGIEPTARIATQDGVDFPVVDGEPIQELFA